ncbi:hypothetical protein BVRB_7g178800 [Beta vulgaris subsp. vulgaris]|uniref:Uncharacterized protein n=1 Tax=Beta vulgaris subsp. vulgaris TaxID=3555 RepID=A0A0J8BAU8_BETVV|nr:hypothetical protein BVRB_7g178800 [Beta vulgaris subsp. vulgaris]
MSLCLLFFCARLILKVCVTWQLDIEELGLDENLKPMSKALEEPIFDYDTIHSLTGGPRGADCNVGRSGRTTGRVARRAGRTQGCAPGRGDQTPSRSAVQFLVNRGGGNANRKRPREPEAEGPQKVKLIGMARGSGSSMRKRIYNKILSAPSFLSDLSPKIYSRVREWIETKEVPLCAAIKAGFSHPQTTPGQLYRSNWNVREDESLYADILANGGTLGYRLLKGLQLPIDCPANKLVVPAAQLAHDLAVANNSVVELITQYVEYQRVAESYDIVARDLQAACDAAVAQANQLQTDLKVEKAAKSEADKELADLRLKAKQLEEVEKKKEEVELALKAAKDETVVAVENAKADAGRLALVEFKRSEEFVGLLGERYDGGWVGGCEAMRLPFPLIF